MKIDDNLLTQALINNNNQVMAELPESTELHKFSRRFEKKMNRLISANSKFGGHIWLERVTRYVTKIAVTAVCLVMVNFVSVKAFDVDIWQVIVTKTSQFIHINFDRENESADFNSSAVRMSVVNIPDGYTEQELYQADNLTVQHFTSENGTITYTESLITETAEINIATGNQISGNIGCWRVSYVINENDVTAFFQDEKFYHIVQVQGEDANKEFVDKIIEELEEQ